MLVENAESIIEILKSEYGIETNQQLDDAIKEQSLIDISVFTNNEFIE